jgi:hypothetical protein
VLQARWVLAVVALVAKADFVSTPAATWAIFLARCLVVAVADDAVVDQQVHSVGKISKQH